MPAPLSTKVNTPNDLALKRAEGFRSILIVLLVVAAALQIIDAAFARLEGTDVPSHIEWLRQFQSLLAVGIAFPKWIPAGYHGLGSAVFYFYPPLTYYLGAVIGLATGVGPRAVFGIIAVLASIASYFTAYSFLRFVSRDKLRCVLGALLYAFAPYRVAELFSRSSLSSHLSYVFIPLVALGVARIIVSEKRFDAYNIAFLAVSAAGILLTSLPATSVVGCFAALLLVVKWRRVGLSGFLQLLLSILVALALTSFYWIPAAVHAQYIQSGSFGKDPGFYLTVLAHGSVTVEVIHAALITGAVLVLLWRPFIQRRKFNTAESLLAISFALYLFLEIPPIAAPLWKHVVMLQVIQVPWRLHILLLLGIAYVIAMPTESTSANRLWIAVWAIAAIGQSILVLANVHLYQHWVAPDAYPPEYLPRSASEEVVHRAVFTRQEIEHPAIDNAMPGDSIVLSSQSPTRSDYHSNLHSAATVHLRQLYWPDWIAYVDGVEVRSFEDSEGFQAVQLPAGDHDLELRFTTRPIEYASRWISGAMLAILLALGFSRITNPGTRGRRRREMVLPKQS